MTGAPPGPGLNDAIDAIVRAGVARLRPPGLSIVVARHGNVLFARGYGERNVGERLSADPDTIYSIASISKQFTVAALLRLAERGLLRVEDPVKRYFPWLRCHDGAELRHVMGHTSGIRDYFALDDLDLIGFSAASPREIAERATAAGSAFEPGAQYQYCNTGYVLLGAILERVAGAPYAHYLAEHFFEPLEMTRSGVDDTPAIHGNLSVGYTSFALGPWELARDYHPSWEFATGGLYSTAVDLLKWNLALRSGHVVRPESLAHMTASGILNDGRASNYGFGLAVNDLGGLREVRHTGGLPGMSTDNATYPEAGIDIIVLVNHDGCSTYATITRPILALLLGNPHLSSARPNDAPANLGLPERPEAHGIIRAAAAGKLDELPITAKFDRFLRPDRRAGLREMGALGAIAGMRFIDANRRDPETTYGYCVDFERARLLAVLTIRDDGTIAGLNFSRWDERG